MFVLGPLEMTFFFTSSWRFLRSSMRFCAFLRAGTGAGSLYGPVPICCIRRRISRLYVSACCSALGFCDVGISLGRVDLAPETAVPPTVGLRFLPLCLPLAGAACVEPVFGVCAMIIFGASCRFDCVLPDSGLSPPGLFTFGMMVSFTHYSAHHKRMSLRQIVLAG